MEPGLILLEDGTSVFVHFSLSREADSGRISASQAHDFRTLVRLYSEDVTVVLQNSRGTWKAHVHILAPETLDPRSTFRFTVQEKIE